MRKLHRSLPLQLLKAREAVMEWFRPHLNAHGVTDQQWRVLRALAEVDESELGALSRLIALLMPSLSRMLPDLEARGLISRRKDNRDGRVVVVSLAPKGRALFDKMSRTSEQIYREIERSLGRNAVAGLLSDLDRLIDVLEAAKQGSLRQTSQSRVRSSSVDLR
jgi:homoprotocatechuate degradation regulator HpaR